MEIETIISIIAIILSVASAAFSFFTYKNDLNRNRKNATLEAYNRLQHEVLDKLYINYNKKDIEEIIANRFKPEYSEKYKILATYVARIEHFCVGVENRIYDRNTVRCLAAGFFNGTVKKLIYPIIDCKDKHSCGDYYHNTRAVIDWLDSKHE